MIWAEGHWEPYGDMDDGLRERLYEISEGDDQLLTDITIATNSQNPVDLRDLRALRFTPQKIGSSTACLWN